MDDLIPSIELIQACWRNLVLGIVQGLTEFLPISSTAHLKVVSLALGWGDPGISHTAAIQLGSILAVIAYFRKDLQTILRGISKAFLLDQWHKAEARLGIAILLGTIPILLAGIAIKLFWPDYETSTLRSNNAIAIVSICMALLLAMAELIGTRKKKIKDVQGIDGLIIGMAQLLALIPGTSRAGCTLTASLFTNWQRKDAARFSFLLGIPAITLAGVVELKAAFSGTATGGLVPLAIGICSSAVMSWLAIDWVLKFLQTNTAWIFVIYRLLFGTLLLLWFN